MATSVPRPRLNVWLSETSLPIIVLDRTRRLVFYNAACEALTGWTADETLGVRCDYRSSGGTAPRDAIAASLAPPPEVYRGESRSVPTFLPRKNGERLSRLIEFFPLPNDKGDVEKVLGLIVPITAPAKPSRASPAHEVHAELAALRMQLRRTYALDNLIGDSPGMQRVFRQVVLARQSLSPLLVCGETGTGRSHVAQTIHHQTAAIAKRPFVPFDCRTAMPIDLIRSLKRIREQFDLAGASLNVPGTIYFQHIEHLERDVQERLLELLQADGEPREIRLAASTTAAPDELLARDRLRPELYFLLTSLTIELPPLRERGDDRLLLAQHFLEEGNVESDRQIGGLTDDVREQFLRYNWPGNVAEMRAVIREACATSSATLIRREDLPFRFRTGFQGQTESPQRPVRIRPLDETLEAIERDQILLALAAAGQNKSQAADLLKIPRPRLYRRMEQLGIADAESSPRSG